MFPLLSKACFLFQAGGNFNSFLKSAIERREIETPNVCSSLALIASSEGNSSPVSRSCLTSSFLNILGRGKKSLMPSLHPRASQCFLPLIARLIELGTSPILSASSFWLNGRTALPVTGFEIGCLLFHNSLQYPSYCVLTAIDYL